MKGREDMPAQVEERIRDAFRGQARWRPDVCGGRSNQR